MKTAWILVLAILTTRPLMSHDWSRHDASGSDAGRLPASGVLALKAANAVPKPSAPPPNVTGTTVSTSLSSESLNLFFEAFSRFKPAVRFHWDAETFHVESDGLPSHGMMVGITAWQQQIPLPTHYFDSNAWRLPLVPKPADTPYLITSNTFLRGAIALAVNGIPIFNPYNNRGEASALIGELDQWGGHCGRADDYHYHVSPLHLTNVVGASLPVAVALDGYPIFGLVEPDGSAVTGLDGLRGHTNVLGRYHYHSSLALPYLHAGFRGTVAYVNNQVDPQPSVRPVRPSGVPLNGAMLTGFTNSAPDRFRLTYQFPGDPASYHWDWSLQRGASSVLVTYVTPAGTSQTSYPNWEPAPPLAPATLRVRTAPEGTLLLQLTGQPGRGYALDSSPDLPNWPSTRYFLFGSDGSTNLTLSPLSDRAFFKLR